MKFPSKDSTRDARNIIIQHPCIFTISPQKGKAFPLRVLDRRAWFPFEDRVLEVDLDRNIGRCLLGTPASLNHPVLLLSKHSLVVYMREWKMGDHRQLCRQLRQFLRKHNSSKCFFPSRTVSKRSAILTVGTGKSYGTLRFHSFRNGAGFTSSVRRSFAISG